MNIKILTLVSVSMLATGCATTYQANEVDASGFLGQGYSRLKEGKSDQALLVYHHPEINKICKNYTKVMIEPISLWVKDEANIADLSVEERQHLTNYLYQSIKKSLGSDYQIVNQAGPDVLRIRGAITEADGSWVVLDTLTSIHPGTVVMSRIKQMGFGSGSFVSETAVEFSIEDSVTRRPFFMGVDKRAGGKNWVKKFDSWGKVEASYDYWTDKLKTRMAECRAGKLEI